ncbi:MULTISPECIES: restriction endonuclease subunit S [unclassified Staphylococcus]|uniref:restriction endonuclease subunit S n=1 Tax=unclassified Staphylococcus TaxID=91994 RepID=UPI0021D37E74|nr:MULTISPECIES: restriction endonuclease subunit S [unclassified Staphylococcus]UXR71724.1 restriction endonuclease subunit S [Staphylococcus sp. IVB6240]UXR76332.1 restriction endonuclease subunit S [Staphylococcus sp. IVB6233]
MEYRKLGDYCEVKGGKRLPKGEQLVEYETNHPYLRISDYSNGSVNLNNLKYVTEETFQKISRYIINEGDIFLSIVGTIGIVDFIDYKLDSASLTENAVRIRSFNESVLSTKFLSYFLKSDQGQNEMFIRTVGSTQPKLAITRIKDINIPIIDIKSQQKISNILSTIDEKITLNKNLIANLEELSQTLFKRWFVDFEFPDENGNPYKSSGGEMVDSELGEIPKGWNVKNLDDIANYVNGLAMQKFKPTDNQNSLPVVKIKELKNGSTDENSNRCTSEIPDKALINDGDIIFSWSATLVVKMWCGGKAGLNQHLFKVSSDKYPKWFYYYWTKRYIDYFIGIANDKATTMGHINRKHLNHAKILIPNDSTLEKFSRTFDDLLEKELSVSKEIKRLIELRDTLLPKLMSGEIEIPDDIEVNEDELSI